MLFRLITVVLTATLTITSAFRIYQDQIPNGDQVPHPCKPNYIWRGVGHDSPLGGGVRNPFGKDFEAVHEKWTRDFCMLDSDNDGMSNGEELGDPDCIWTKGMSPQRITQITHPGVCDPWGSEQCQEANRDVTCETGEFICDEINSPDVFNVTLRFPPTKVPAKETTYICMTFELDMLTPGIEYHLIATKPFTDNEDVMHHTTLSGCQDSSSKIETPTECNMGGSGCREGLSIWTLGLPGECWYKDAGFKVGGSDGIHRVSMQHHWTNPSLVDDYMDSSGMVLYLTKKLRKYNAGFFSTGEGHIVIPPGQERVVIHSSCKASCTRKMMKSPIFLMSGWNHMHYLGYQQNVEHFRNGQKLRDLTPDEVYSYDNPIIHEYDPVVEVRPGDNLETTCVFRSTSRKNVTKFGPGSYDEMCVGIFTFFPAENLKGDTCATFDDLDFCELTENYTIRGCDLSAALDENRPETKALHSKVYEKCGVGNETVCDHKCIRAIKDAREHACLKGTVGKYMDYIYDLIPDLKGKKFFDTMNACEPIYPNSAVITSSVNIVIVLATVLSFVLIL